MGYSTHVLYDGNVPQIHGDESMSDENYTWKDRQRATSKRDDLRDRWMNFIVWIGFLALFFLTLSAVFS